MHGHVLALYLPQEQGICTPCAHADAYSDCFESDGISLSCDFLLLSSSVWLSRRLECDFLHFHLSKGHNALLCHYARRHRMVTSEGMYDLLLCFTIFISPPTSVQEADESTLTLAYYTHTYTQSAAIPQ